MITPAKVSVGVDLSLSNLAAPPGTTLSVIFEVFNSGPDATYDFFATDDQGYVDSYDPLSSFIPSQESVEVTLTLVIPEDAIPWTQSTIIVTASSQTVSYDVNSDIAYFIVLPVERDTNPPVCQSTSEQPNCQGFSSSSNCDQSTWTVSAVIYDDESELTSVYTQPSNNDTDIELSEGNGENFDSVNVDLEVSCCVRELSLIGVDSQGNVGTCDYDLGELDGGTLVFEAIDAGTTWILLEWTVSEVPENLFFYTVVTDNLFNNDVKFFSIIISKMTKMC